MIWTLTYPKGEVEHKHLSLKCREVWQRSFIVFILLFCTLKRGLKSTTKPVYSSLHLSQVIKYMIFLLLQEKCHFIMYVLPVILDVSFLSANEKCLQMSQEVHGVIICTCLLTDLG